MNSANIVDCGGAKGCYCYMYTEVNCRGAVDNVELGSGSDDGNRASNAGHGFVSMQCSYSY